MKPKLLIANRGEIACRVIRSCAALGITTVAVYSEADKDSLHVSMADEAIHIGPAPARESYLRVDAIIDAAQKTSATLVHPGYGFLSENAAFAEAVQGAGLIWVGPAPESIIAMGDKERAREIARVAGVPVLPGSARFYPDDQSALLKAAENIGFPLLVKAAAGGGGIGMRRVDSPDDLAAVVSATQSMASNAFGDSAVYLERLVEHARHIEVQIFGFGDGTAVHLYDRECSIQRRYQKIIEEAPAPQLPPALRKSLHECAVALASAQQYSGAGTVEFVYDCVREEAYFLEMNTRIQVEHPVTEMITGVDLVSWQILHVMGELQRPNQGDIPISGHALECRLYAERPEKNFLPSPGQISALNWPETGRDLRVDTGVRTGDRITPYYDPMIAKIITRGGDRDGAIYGMETALAGLTIEGLKTNAAFLSNVLDDEDFRAGVVTTRYVEQFINQSKVVA